MSLIYLVRHGHAAAGRGDDGDPGLDGAGRRQAAEAARVLVPLGPLPIVSSPLARARQTAAPLEKHWGGEVRIEPRLGEIPFPERDLAARAAWLKAVMARRWPELDGRLQAWRRAVRDAVGELTTDTVVFTHFIAINVIVGEALGDERLVVFLPDNCSVTVVENKGDKPLLVEKGCEMKTVVW